MGGPTLEVHGHNDQGTFLVIAMNCVGSCIWVVELIMATIAADSFEFVCGSVFAAVVGVAA